MFKVEYMLISDYENIIYYHNNNTRVKILETKIFEMRFIDILKFVYKNISQKLCLNTKVK